MIRLEGRGDYIEDSICGHCKDSTPTIRCTDCFLPELHCPSCTGWNGHYFEQISLKTLGLRIQLGHPFNDDFIIIDTTGIHEVALDFCACGTMQTHVKQLLRARLFPATITEPKTAATFNVLEQYHKLSFESKASAFEFYHGLACLSDNDHYATFLCVVHKWRILKLLKHFARGHCPDGVETTEPGQCAVLCPACPQPGKNLPEDWKDSPPDKCDNVDPRISKGWSYFIEEKAYKTYLDDHKGRNQECSTCASHNAMNMANTKKAGGLAAIGVGTVDCARHNMKLQNAVGDLQKGKNYVSFISSGYCLTTLFRYINMDYLFFSAMSHHDVVVLNISYDIACQWSKHLWSRMLTLPSDFHLDYDSKAITFLVPKFHLPAHIEQCQIDFSFNLSRYVGRTDGEAPEHGWANINPIASSMKEMGPGSRRDTLDDHFGDWNWKHCTQLGRLIARKLAHTIEQKAEHQRELIELESCLQVEDTSQWRNEVEAWEQDRSQTNPFQVRVTPETQATVQLELACIEATELESGTNISLHTDVSPSVLISSGIDLEEQQYIAALGVHATDNQLAKIQQHINSLRRKIESWQDIQLLYLPFVSLLHASEEPCSPSNSTPVEALQLWLPSAIGPDTRCAAQLRIFEWKLCYAQANDALKDIRNLLCLRSHLYKFKDSNIVGQAANTRARSTINKADAKVNMAAERYEAARAALASLALILNEDRTWKEIFKPLNRSKDLKALKDMWEKETEGTQHLSLALFIEDALIFTLFSALHIKWCKARARAMRWDEEVNLLKEEQRRVVAFLDWQADWWWSQRERHDLEYLDDTLREGLATYAERQASLRQQLSTHFQILWTPPTLPTPSAGTTT
ncbi:hypothetical protein F4604DRAFT_1883371 [Suillus subluteus]|nr:hypothetical protein F4604DRAFT_1883371 [Suillus subluteus]